MTYLHSKPPIYMFIFSFYIAQTGIIVFLFFKHLSNSIYFIHFLYLNYRLILPAFYLAYAALVYNQSIFLFLKIYLVLIGFYFVYFSRFTLATFLRYNSTPKKELLYAV